MRMKNMLFNIGSSLLPSLLIGFTFVIVPEMKQEEVVQVEEENEEVDEEEEEVVPVGQILTGNAALYSDMSGTRILARLEKGTLANIIFEYGKYWEVEYGNIRGYIDSSHIAKVDEFDRELFEQPVIVLNEGIYQEENQEPQNSDLSKTGAEAEVTDDAESITEIETLSSKTIQILKGELERRGYTIIQIPENEIKNLSDRERCEFANEIQADAYLTIFDDKEINGVQAICPMENNPYSTVRLYRQSYQLSEFIMEARVAETGGEKGSPEESKDFAGVNWSKVPITILKVGGLKDEAEGTRDENCQEKIALWIANGVDYYFGKNQEGNGSVSENGIYNG